MDKNLLVAAFTLSGTMIGAGILGLPYVFAQSGFFIGLFWLIMLTIIVLVTLLSLGEISLRVEGKHHLPGYANIILGKQGRLIILIAMMVGIFFSLISYLIGEGQSLSTLIFGNIKYAFLFGILFWFGMSLLLKKGIKGLKKVETYGMFAIIFITLIILFFFIGKIDTTNYFQPNYTKFLLPFGTVLFALLGFTSIPEMNMVLENKGKLKKAILMGVLIPFVIYFLFAFIVVGISGKGVAEVATLTPQLGTLTNLLGIFTMLTSYFVLSYSVFDLFLFDLYMEEKKAYYLSILPPLIIFLFLTILRWDSFIKIISIGGAISGGIVGSMAVIMNYKAKKMRLGSPQYKIRMNKYLVAFIVLIFCIGIVSLFFSGI